MSQFSQCKICGSEIETINTGYNLVECVNCKLVFCKEIFSDQSFKEVYDKLYNQTKSYDAHIKESDDLLSNKIKRLGRTKQMVLKHILGKKDMRVLEIGAGVGVVAHYLQKLGIQYLGIEIDEKTVQRAKKKTLNVIEGDFKSLRGIDGNFDSVVAFEVIEHLQELDQLFDLVNGKLSDKGYFGFTVPNYNKRLNYQNSKDKIYQSGPPVHLNFFTTENIVNIAKLYHFDVVVCKEKRFPYFNWNRTETYLHIGKALFGQYRGSTIITVLQKK